MSTTTLLTIIYNTNNESQNEQFVHNYHEKCYF